MCRDPTKTPRRTKCPMPLLWSAPSSSRMSYHLRSGRSASICRRQSSAGFSLTGSLKRFPSLHMDLHSAYSMLESRCRSSLATTYDLRLSPSFLKLSIILNMSFLPSLALTSLPAIVMLTLEPESAVKSLFNKRCFINRHTNTPQSLPLSCCGVSSMLTNRNCRPSSCASLCAAACAGRKLSPPKLS